MGTRVLIVDDHAGFRRQARAMLEDEGFAVVGEAAEGSEAVRLAVALRPDVVLLDVQLPDTDGFAVARRLVDGGLGATIVLTSARQAAEFDGKAEAAPADAFITKRELTATRIAAVAAGGTQHD